MAEEGIEKRKYVRFPFPYKIDHRLCQSEKWINSLCDNLSLNGILFFSDNLYLERDKIEVNLTNPYEKNNVLTLNATVIWVLKVRKDSGEIFLVGAQFIDLSEEKYEYLKKFIHDCILKVYETSKNLTIKDHRYKILFMDDNISLTKLFTCLGAEYDFEAIVANTFSEGFKLATTENPDVIITDINIPDGDGFSLAARLKVDEKTKNIPIVGCSVTYPKGGKKFFLLGGNKFVNDKPSSIEKLNYILEGILPQITLSF